MTGDQTALLATLRDIVGARHVLTSAASVHHYSTGYRYGAGAALAVVRPGTPLQQYAAFRACVEADVIVIVQAANTGLTGGSTPDGSYDRPVVIINTLRIDGIHAIRGGQQVVCLAGATLHALERKLFPLGREPHSVIGSSCIGASVIGGICNSSGGALVRRGPAYTECALFARVTQQGSVELVNHLGIDLGGTVEEMLARLATGAFDEEAVRDCERAASAGHYAEHVRAIEEATPARYNADPDRLYEASGSAGKVMVLAVRLDTFPQDERTATFYIGTNDPAELDSLRRAILRDFQELPILGEYIHREAFDVAATYGKDVFLAVERLGVRRLPWLFSLKSRIDSLASRMRLLPAHLSDRLMQGAAALFPQHLPPRIREWRDKYEHHLILKLAGQGIDEGRALLAAMFPSGSGDAFECTPTESQKALLHRFAVAGAAIRYRAIHQEEVGEIIALDIALRRNDREWFEHLPPDVRPNIRKALYYGHFFCHVFHQDYITQRNADAARVEQRMWEILDERGARYPAEHNVGHHYRAAPSLAAHYQALDPCNQLNPGIGQTSRKRNWH